MSNEERNKYTDELARMVYKLELEHQIEDNDVLMLSSEVCNKVADLAKKDGNAKISLKFMLNADVFIASYNQSKRATIYYNEEQAKKSASETIDFIKNDIPNTNNDIKVESNHTDVDIDFEEIKSREMFNRSK